MMRYFPDVEIIDKKVSFETIKEDLKEGWQLSIQRTFTKEKYEKFIKISLIPFIIILILLTIFITLMMNIKIGITTLIACSLLGIVYYLILKKICKY